MNRVAIIIGLLIMCENIKGCTCAGNISFDYFALVEVIRVYEKDNNYLIAEVKTKDQIKGESVHSILISRGCMLSLKTGEEWLIHAALKNEGLMTNQCSSSLRFRDSQGNVELERQAYLKYNKSKQIGRSIANGQNIIKDKGRILIKENYKEGQLHGERVSYYRNGNIRITEEFKEGANIGERRYYFLDGGIKKIETFRTGLKTVLFENQRMYYSTGTLKMTRTLVGGRIEGEELRYHSNGNIWQRVCFEGGKREGFQDRYDERGNLIRKEYYKKGELQRGHLQILVTYNDKGLKTHQEVIQYPLREVTHYLNDGKIRSIVCKDMKTNEIVERWLHSENED